MPKSEEVREAKAEETPVTELPRDPVKLLVEAAEVLESKRGHRAKTAGMIAADIRALAARVAEL